MKKIIIAAVLLISFASLSRALDEDTYVRFVADSIIASYKGKGNPNASGAWADEMKRLYPDVASQDLISFEGSLARDAGRKAGVCDRILENVKSRGYRAHISRAGGGTTVEIED